MGTSAVSLLRLELELQETWGEARLTTNSKGVRGGNQLVALVLVPGIEFDILPPDKKNAPVVFVIVIAVVVFVCFYCFFVLFC